MRRPLTSQSKPARTSKYQQHPSDSLLSQGVYTQVPLARAGLTAMFGMGTGVTPPLWSPEILRRRGLHKWNISARIPQGLQIKDELSKIQALGR